MLWPEVENRPWAVAYNGRKGAQLVVREVKGGAFAVSKAYKPQLLFCLRGVAAVWTH